MKFLFSKLFKKYELNNNISYANLIICLIASLIYINTTFNSAHADPKKPTNIIAQDTKTGSTITTDIPRSIPKYLYTWVSPETLLNLAIKGFNYKSGWVNNLGGLTGILNDSFPQFKESGVRGTYAWHVPELSTRGGIKEYYGEVLIRFELKDNIDLEKVWHVTNKNSASPTGDPKNPTKLNPFQSDLELSKYSENHLIFHDSMTGGSVFSEWIITNASIIKSFTVDQNELRKVLETGIKRATNGHSYKFTDYHFIMPFGEPFDTTKVFTGGEFDAGYVLHRLNGALNQNYLIPPNFFPGKSNATKAQIEEYRKKIYQFRLDEVRLFTKEYSKRIDIERVKYNPKIVSKKFAYWLIEEIAATEQDKSKIIEIDQPIRKISLDNFSYFLSNHLFENKYNEEFNKLDVDHLNKLISESAPSNEIIDFYLEKIGDIKPGKTIIKHFKLRSGYQTKLRSCKAKTSGL